MVTCPGCGREYPEGTRFCVECNQELEEPLAQQEEIRPSLQDDPLLLWFFWVLASSWALPLWFWGTGAQICGLGLPALGVGLGLGQWLVLRSLKVTRAEGWVLATPLGQASVVVMMVGYQAYDSFGIVLWRNAAVAAIIAAAIGAAQWLVLRGTFRRAALWIPATMAGWGLPTAAFLIWYECVETSVGCPRAIWSLPLGVLMLGGPFYGLVSAAMLAYLQTRRK